MVRRLVGYQQRLEAPLAALERVHELCELPPPGTQLTEKVRRGARITRRYEVAQTPYCCVLASGVAARNTERQLAIRWQRSIHSG